MFASSLPRLSSSGPCPHASFLEADAWAPRRLVQTQDGRTHRAALFPECQSVVQLPVHTDSGLWASSAPTSGAALFGNHSGLQSSICRIRFSAIPHILHDFWSATSVHSCFPASLGNFKNTYLMVDGNSRLKGSLCSCAPSVASAPASLGSFSACVPLDASLCCLSPKVALDAKWL